MRLTIGLLPPSLLIALTTALQLPNLHPYLPAVYFPSISDYLPPNTPNTTSSTSNHQEAPHDLLKRQFSNTCPTDFSPCDNVGAPGLCCYRDAACVADDAGHVACCPPGAVCTGVVNGVITSGTVDGEGDLVLATESAAAGAGGAVVTSVGSSYVMTASGAANNGGLVAASSPSTVAPGAGESSSGGAFIIDGGSTVATPGAAVRGVELPIVAKMIIRVLEMVPL